MTGSAASVDYDDYWPPKHIHIKFDLNSVDLLPAVVHELLHVAFTPLVATLDETLEEVFILSMEEYFCNYIKASKARLEKWNTLIESKLAETDGTLKSLEEQAERP